MKRAMLDLETLGTAPGCVILSIGAVEFDATTGKLGEGYHQAINIESCHDAGLIIDHDTSLWWSGQSEEARELLNIVRRKDTPTLSAVLLSFSNYLAPFGPDVEVYGNGADFDNAILSYCYHIIGASRPWGGSKSRCYRTLKELVPHIKMEKRVGVHHNALDDAKSQALHAIEILRFLHKRVLPGERIQD